MAYYYYSQTGHPFNLVPLSPTMRPGRTLHVHLERRGTHGMRSSTGVLFRRCTISRPVLPDGYALIARDFSRCSVTSTSGGRAARALHMLGSIYAKSTWASLYQCYACRSLQMNGPSHFSPRFATQRRRSSRSRLLGARSVRVLLLVFMFVIIYHTV